MTHREEICRGELVVFFEDECHLLWGDLCGYVWGKTSERVEIPMTNERSKQTYYGAVDFYISGVWFKLFNRVILRELLHFSSISWVNVPTVELP